MAKESIKNAVFLKSSSKITQCPAENKPEVAFIGRSNVGKSSLINMLCERKSLAKTSSRPGKTQLINHFEINEHWYLVDLPGYGWAKVSKEKKAAWGEMIEAYLLERNNLVSLFILIDSRLEPQAIDVDFINWAGQQGIPLALVFTKTDKQSKNKSDSKVAKMRKTLKTTWEELPPIFTTSAVTGSGKEALMDYLIEITSL
jgi:GTP-binding protein